MLNLSRTNSNPYWKSLMQNKPLQLSQSEWLQIHHSMTNLTASQISTVLGMNKFESSFTLHMRKRGLLEWPDETRAMRRGHHMETFIGREFRRETGHVVVPIRAYKIWQHPEHKWLYATPDFFVRERKGGPLGVLEIKAPGIHEIAEWKGTEAPLSYGIQAQVQMACTGLEYGYVGGLIGNELYVHRYTYRPNLFNGIAHKGLAFLDGIASETPPPVDDSPSTYQTIKELHPDDNEETVMLASSLALSEGEMETDEVVRRWQKCGKFKAAWEKKQKHYEAALRLAVGNYTYGQTMRGTRLSMETTERAGYEVQATKYRTLRVKKGEK